MLGLLLALPAAAGAVAVSKTCLASAGSATARHVPARPPAGRGTGPRRGSRTGSRPGGMKLGAQKLKPKPEEAFEF